MTLSTAYLIGSIFALAGAILMAVFVLPEKRQEKLSPFLRKVADICNFKVFFLEYILKFLYVFCTVFCVFAGFFMLFAKTAANDLLALMGAPTVSAAPSGLILMFAGPVIVRLVYEICMLFVKLVSNTNQINNKLEGKNDQNPEA